MNIKKSLLTILIIIIIIIISVMAFGGYKFYEMDMKITKNNNISKTIMKAVSKDGYYKAAINDVILNITTKSGKIRLMKLSLELISYNPHVQEIINSKIEEITDMLIMTIDSRTTEELSTITGQDLLIDDIIDNINKKVRKESRNLIKNASFTSLKIS